MEPHAPRNHSVRPSSARPDSDRPGTDRPDARRPASLPGPDQPMVVRSPGDFVAFVPVALGFVPQSSVVMLTFDARGSSFHARIDLPGRDECDDVVEQLLAPVRRHDIERVALLAYGPRAECEEIGWRLRDALLDDGVEVIDVLHVEGAAWASLAPGSSGLPAAGLVDLDSHRFSAQAVVAGRVRHASRDALRRTIEEDPARSIGPVPGSTPRLAPGALARLVGDRWRAGELFDDDELDLVARCVSHPGRRDAVWSGLDRSGAERAVGLWKDAASRLPDERAPDVCAVLAFVAWLAGDGALAWCAVDRCRRVQPRHTLAGVVVQLLVSAAHPDEWSRWQGRHDAPDGPAA